MKRGKDEEKSKGLVMFPRFHVNDTEKGGPRAPPRNKMALYEQLSMPSQRFSNGDLSPNAQNNAKTVPPSSSQQGRGHERGTYFPLRGASSTRPSEEPHSARKSELRNPAVQLEQKKRDEEDFMVPIFVHSRMGQTLRDDSARNLRRLENNDANLQPEHGVGSQPNKIASDQTSPVVAINYSENRHDKTSVSLQSVPVEGSDDFSEASMVDSVSVLDISPDDVVGMIGLTHFTKARRAIVNQQRVFAVQLFELHRLIKVQRSIAGSPHLLLKEIGYLGNPLKPPPHIIKHKHVSMMLNQETEDSENVSSGYPSIYGPFSAKPPPKPASPDTLSAPLSFSQSPGHQWLVPIMSPSEGLIYKPYSGPGPVDPISGGYRPPCSTQVMGNFFNPTYGVPNFSHGYNFPPYGSPVMNNFAGLGSQGHFCQFPGEAGPNFNMHNQSSCYAPSSKTGVISSSVKSHVVMNGKSKGSTRSSLSERAQVVGRRHTTEGRNVLPHLPTFVLDHEDLETGQPAHVIRVVPHNARSATESAARIFQSIQEQRKQSDLG